MILVCKQWYLAILETLYIYPHLLSPESFRSFQRTLNDHPQLCSRVKSIFILDLRLNRRLDQTISKFLLVSLCLSKAEDKPREILTQILKMCLDVHSVAIHSAHASSCLVPLSPEFVNSSGFAERLQTLVISNAAFTSVCTQVELTALKELHLYNVSPKDPGPSLNCFRGLPNLRTLCISNTEILGFRGDVAFRITPEVLPHLRTLELRNNIGIPEIHADSLRMLQVFFFIGPFSNTLADHFRRGGFESLRELTIGCTSLTQEQADKLASKLPPQLRTLRLIVFPQESLVPLYGSSEGSILLRTIRGALQAGSCPRLQRISLVLKRRVGIWKH